MAGQEKQGYAITVVKYSSHILAEEKEDFVYRSHQFACTNKNM